MNEPSSNPPPSQAVRRGPIDRTQIAINVIVQVVVMFTLVILVNYISFRKHRSFDLSTTGKFTLSPQTVAVLDQLQEPCKVVVSFHASTPLAEQLQEQTVIMLREYEAQSNRKLSVEFVDPAVNPLKARELEAKYKFSPSESVVIVDYKSQSKWVKVEDFAELTELPEEKQDRERQQIARIKSFKAEQYVTAALMELIEGKPSYVYFVGGHGEKDLLSSDMSIVQQYFLRQNYRVENLLLATKDKIPADADALVIAGPIDDFSDRDVRLLDEYWSRNGKIFLAVGPENRGERLAAWVRERGINLHRDDVMFLTRKLTETGSMAYEKLNAQGKFLPGTPITSGIAGQDYSIPGSTQSMEPVQAMVKAGQITGAALLVAHPLWWGETTPVVQGMLPTWDPTRDYPKKQGEPLALGIAIEKGAARDALVKLQTPRLVVVGNGFFFTDPGVEMSRPGLNLMLNSMNWLLSRDNMLALPAKEVPMNDVDLNDDQLARLGWTLIFGLPMVFGLFGLYYIWWRHGKNLIVLSLILLGAAVLLWGGTEALQKWGAPPPSNEDLNPLP